MLHGPTVSLLCGSDVVGEGHAAAAEESFETLRHFSTESQRIFPCSVSRLLDFQAVLICSCDLKIYVGFIILIIKSTV